MPKFNLHHVIVCDECGFALMYCPRQDGSHTLLWHDKNKCVHAGKWFYPPQIELTEAVPEV